MKKILLVLVLALFANSYIMAQDDNDRRPQGGFRGARMNPKERTEQMIKELELNETQAAQFRVVMEEQQKEMQAQMEAARKESTGERPTKEQMEKMRAKFQEQQQAINIVLQVILTEEQFAKYQEMNQRRGPGRRGGQGGPRMGGEDGVGGFRERTE